MPGPSDPSDSFFPSKGTLGGANPKLSRAGSEGKTLERESNSSELLQPRQGLDRNLVSRPTDHLKDRSTLELQKGNWRRAQLGYKHQNSERHAVVEVDFSMKRNWE